MREALLVLALLVAGCATPAAETVAPVATPPSLAVSLLNSASGCASFCEPNVAILPTGEWFALGDSLTRSVDAGATFDEVALPPSPLGPTSFQTDTLVQAAPDGALFYSALVASCALVSCSALVLGGVQVARSTDAGERWDSTFLSFPQQLGGFGADRQWLAFGPDGLVCVHFQYVGTITAVGLVNTGAEVRSSCSTDGGRTFPDFVSVTGVVPNGVINGRGIFDVEGRYIIPYIRLDRDGALFLAVSEDQGSTFTELPVEGASGDYFPALASDAAGALHLLWRDAAQAVAYATSVDGGATWSQARVLTAKDEMTPTSPWIEPLGDGIVATWFVAEDDEANALVHWDGERTTLLAEGLPDSAFRAAATDFAHLAARGDTALVVFGDLDAEETVLAVVGS